VRKNALEDRVYTNNLLSAFLTQPANKRTIAQRSHQYLKNINDPCSTENHGDQLIGHLSKLCTRIFDKNLEKEKIKFKEIYSIISNSGMHPHLSTSTIIPYTYNISGHSRPIICAFQTINSADFSHKCALKIYAANAISL